MQETQVWSQVWEDLLEKEMAAHSSILAWKIPWTVEPGRLPSMGSQRVRHDWATSLSLSPCLVVVQKVKVKVLVAHLCPTLSNPVDCSLPGSSAHGIFQARILEWVASHSLLQQIFLTQGWNLGLPYGRQSLYHLSHQGNPIPCIQIEISLTSESYVCFSTNNFSLQPGPPSESLEALPSHSQSNSRVKYLLPQICVTLHLPGSHPASAVPPKSSLQFSSSLCTIKGGEAQSSVPGPLSFSTYTYFLGDLVQMLGFKHYLEAEDCHYYNLAFSSSPSCQTGMSNCLLDIIPWMPDKYLKLIIFKPIS